MKLVKIKNIDYLVLGKSKVSIEGHLDSEIGLYFELSTKNEIQGFYESLDILLTDIPNNIRISVWGDSEIEDYKFTSIFTLFSIEKRDNKIFVTTSSSGFDLSHIDYKDYIYFRAMVSEIQNFKPIPEIHYSEKNCHEDDSVLSLTYSFREEKISIKTVFENKITTVLAQLQSIVDLQINDYKWNPKYEKNEKMFSLELLHPLFLKMGFEKVIYNHGTKEFGKDFVLSKLNEFGIEDYYGVQVKAGNVSGKVNSQIDELIGQCYDAFSVPWKNIKRNEFYISKIIIAISGVFSENAKIKIQNKLTDIMNANIIFLDKDLITSLNRKYLEK